MTLGDLLREHSNLRQYRMMEIADRLLPCGRYYAGQLTPDEIEAITETALHNVQKG